MKDYYAILGIAPDAAAEVIKAAYRQRVQAHHPDHNPDDPNATEHFLEIKDAYDCLSDPATREAYDIAFVATFPGYELEADEEEVDDLPIQPMPDQQEDAKHDDGSNTLLRIFMVLILPLLSGGLVMNFSGDFTWTVLAAVAGLVAALWIGATLSRD